MAKRNIKHRHNKQLSLEKYNRGVPSQTNSHHFRQLSIIIEKLIYSKQKETQSQHIDNKMSSKRKNKYLHFLQRTPVNKVTIMLSL